MLSTAAIAIAGALGGITVWKLVGLGFKLFQASGADKKVATEIASIGPVTVATKSATFNDAANVALNQHAIPKLKDLLITKGLWPQFVAYMATGPSGSQILQWLLANAGTAAVTEVKDDLPSLLKDELGVLGHDLNGVVGTLVSQAATVLGARAITAAAVTAQATTASAMQAKLEALSGGAGGAVAPATGKAG